MIQNTLSDPTKSISCDKKKCPNQRYVVSTNNTCVYEFNNCMLNEILPSQETTTFKSIDCVTKETCITIIPEDFLITI